MYADSLTAVSAPGFRYSGDTTHPGRVDGFRRSIARVQQMPCDILLSVHPVFSRLLEKRDRHREAPGTNPFVERDGCRAYAADAARRLDLRLAEEK